MAVTMFGTPNMQYYATNGTRYIADSAGMIRGRPAAVANGSVNKSRRDAGDLRLWRLLRPERETLWSRARAA
jgi:hypothetical protein